MESLSPGVLKKRVDVAPEGHGQWAWWQWVEVGPDNLSVFFPTLLFYDSLIFSCQICFGTESIEYVQLKLGMLLSILRDRSDVPQIITFWTAY